MSADASSSHRKSALLSSKLRHCITSRRCLRCTSSQRYERQRTCLKFGKRSFSCAGQRAWNSLPSSLHELMNNTSIFKRHLKAFLFQQAYGCWRVKFSRWHKITNCISPVFYAYICIYMCFLFLTFKGVLLSDFYFLCPYSLCLYM